MNKRIEPCMDRGSWLMAMCIAAAAVAYVTCLYVPQSRAVSDTLAQVDAKQAFILESQKSLHAAELAKIELRAAVDYNAKYRAQLLASDELPPLFKEISQIAKSNQIIMPRFEPHPAVAYDSFQQITIDLGLAGPFASLFRFIARLEALPARIWIEDLKIHAPRESGKTVTFEMQLVVYVDNPENSD